MHASRTGWVALAVSLAAYVIVALIMGQPFHIGSRALNFFDLRIYRDGAERAAHGVSLYTRPMIGHLGFTYPPFAALFMLPLAAAGQTIDDLLILAVNLALLLWLMRSTLALAGLRPRWGVAALLAGAALWLEPVSVTLGYGQIDLLIAALIVWDLSRPDTARTKGIGIGLAAALKLTPLLFIPYLLLSGRRRAAGVASAVFAASIAIPYAAIPADARRYWGGDMFLNASRIGGGSDTANQSLRGAIARLLPNVHGGFGVELLIVCVALGGLWLAVRFSRRGDEPAGFSVVALSALLVSPVSWTHHWTIAVPALVLLTHRAVSRHSPLTLTAAAGLAAVGYSYLPEFTERTRHATGAVTLLIGDPYVMVALMVLGAVCAVQTHVPSRESWRALSQITRPVQPHS